MFYIINPKLYNCKIKKVFQLILKKNNNNFNLTFILMRRNQKSQFNDFNIKGRSLSDQVKGTKLTNNRKFQQYISNQMKGYLQLGDIQTRSERSETMQSSGITRYSTEAKIKVVRNRIYGSRNSLIKLVPSTETENLLSTIRTPMFRIQETQFEAEQDFKDNLIYRPQQNRPNVFQIKKSIPLPKVVLTRDLQSGLSNTKLNIRSYLQIRKYGHYGIN
ncbi:hypothetical protein pb186bvf_005068 [Paramecium bursaria]